MNTKVIRGHIGKRLTEENEMEGTETDEGSNQIVPVRSRM